MAYMLGCGYLSDTDIRRKSIIPIIYAGARELFMCMGIIPAQGNADSEILGQYMIIIRK